MTKHAISTLELLHAYVRDYDQSKTPPARDEIAAAIKRSAPGISEAADELIRRGQLCRVVTRKAAGRNGGTRYGYCMPDHPLAKYAVTLTGPKKRQIRAKPLPVLATRDVLPVKRHAPPGLVEDAIDNRSALERAWGMTQ